ncbi:anti sigma factor C-terminal domain-containing protein [Streptococcus caprae]|uniref:Anti sigma factor C-terminal domain-containing protein n=1 Tax=Streptococcus caprae TaxID=1640501 RepID=A0ABV8CU67_9STRE
MTFYKKFPKSSGTKTTSTSDPLMQIAKKQKRKNRWRTVLISSLASLTLLVAGTKVLTEITSSHGRQVQDYYQTLSEIAYPNVDYRSSYFEPSSNFSGQFVSDRTKDIDGIQVFYERYIRNYSLTGAVYGNGMSTTTDQEGMTYTRLSNLKVPIFYNVKHTYDETSENPYDKTAQELSYVKEMTDQAVEVALTFDKAYTIAEIAELVPDNLKVEWYWIGTESTFDTSQLGPSNQLGLEIYDQAELSAQQIDQLEQIDSAEEYSQAYEKLVQENGELTDEKIINNNFTYFKKYAQKALDKGWLELISIGSEDGTWTADQDLKVFLDKYKTGTEAKFAGIIVTGRAENFAQLEDKDWIFASSIGQSVQIQPYHKLDK